MTSAAVLTDLFHLVGDSAKETDVAWRLVRSGVPAVLPTSDEDLPALEVLMRKYYDRPMDFADATLVHLAETEAVATIFTINHNDFATYLIEGRKRFRIPPNR